jgi:hypothetical protein
MNMPLVLLNRRRRGGAQVPLSLFTSWDDTADTYVTTGAGALANIHQKMRRCVLNANGTVNYYLSTTDSTLKADGVTPSNLSGADGNVMVEIPKFWYRHTLASTLNTWEIADGSIAGFSVHPAFVKAGAEVPYRYVSAYDACLQFSRSVTAVADAGSGDITVTTSAQHPLYAGDSVTISGTTSYNGTYTVVSRASTTTFTVTAAFVATETGTAAGYVSGKNLDDMTANIQTGLDKLASVDDQYPLIGVTRPECRTLSANNGTGWHQLDFALWSAIQMLYLVEYANFSTQANLGAGNTNGSYLSSSVNQTDSPHTIAGASNALGNASTNTTTGAGVSAKPGTSFMSYRGIENWYGNCWNWADGINVNVTATGNVHITNDYRNFADGTATGHTLVSSAFPTGNGFIRNILNTAAYFLSSTNSGGSSTTYLTDQHFASASASRVVGVGGSAGDGAVAGGFCLLSDRAASLAYRFVGARLCF